MSHHQTATSRALIDCPLHPLGIKQTLEQAPLLHDHDFSVVFVNPLRRTLQTCNFPFASHPRKDRIKFVVVPELREWIRY